MALYNIYATDKETILATFEGTKQECWAYAIDRNYDVGTIRRVDSKVRADNVVLKRTCYACPEQYDAIIKDTGEIVGYLRLRHGCFTVEVPDVGGELIYESYPAGDGMFGDKEREEELLDAVAAIISWYNKEE